MNQDDDDELSILDKATFSQLDLQLKRLRKNRKPLKKSLSNKELRKKKSLIQMNRKTRFQKARRSFRRYMKRNKGNLKVIIP